MGRDRLSPSQDPLTLHRSAGTWGGCQVWLYLVQGLWGRGLACIGKGILCWYLIPSPSLCPRPPSPYPSHLSLVLRAGTRG